MLMLSLLILKKKEEKRYNLVTYNLPYTQKKKFIKNLMNILRENMMTKCMVTHL